MYLLLNCEAKCGGKSKTVRIFENLSFGNLFLCRNIITFKPGFGILTFLQHVRYFWFPKTQNILSGPCSQDSLVRMFCILVSTPAPGHRAKLKF